MNIIQYIIAIAKQAYQVSYQLSLIKIAESTDSP